MVEAPLRQGKECPRQRLDLKQADFVELSEPLGDFVQLQQPPPKGELGTLPPTSVDVEDFSPL